jgi:hypothetical protein
MKKIAIFFVAIVVPLSFFSCQEDLSRVSYAKYQERHIKSENTALKVTIPERINKGASEIFDPALLEFIPLETTNESLIGTITDIQSDGDTLFIADFLNQKAVSIFTKNGKYLHTISRLGKGPQEYLSCFDFQVDNNNNIIYILDGNNGYILGYDYEGNFIEKIQLPLSYVNHFILSDHGTIYLDCGYRPNDSDGDEWHNIIEIDKLSGDIIHSYFPYNPELFQLRIKRKLLSKSDTNIYTWELLGQQVYRIERDSLSTVYTLSEDIETLCPSYFYGYTHGRFREEFAENGYRSINGFLEFKEWFYAGIMEGNYIIHNFVNKFNGQSFFDVSYMNINSSQAAIILPPQLFKIDEHTLCAYCSPIMVKHMDMVPEDLKNSLDESDNPVVILYSLR